MHAGLPEEKVARLSSQFVPRPLLYKVGVGLIIIGFLLCAIGFFIYVDEAGWNYPEDVVAAVAAMQLGAAAEALGWVMFLTGCVIHSIRTEAALIRDALKP